MVSFGCATTPETSRFRLPPPNLEVGPIKVDCKIRLPGENEAAETKCVLVYLPDWVNVVEYVKAACIGHGMTEEQCGAE